MGVGDSSRGRTQWGGGPSEGADPVRGQGWFPEWQRQRKTSVSAAGKPPGEMNLLDLNVFCLLWLFWVATDLAAYYQLCLQMSKLSFLLCLFKNNFRPPSISFLTLFPHPHAVFRCSDGGNMSIIKSHYLRHLSIYNYEIILLKISSFLN